MAAGVISRDDLSPGRGRRRLGAVAGHTACSVPFTRQLSRYS